MKRGLYLAPFDGLANPPLLAELPRAAESVGWDGLFLWATGASRWASGSASPTISGRSANSSTHASVDARWDGLFRIDLSGPEGPAELAEEVRQARAGSDGPFDLLVEVPPGTDVRSNRDRISGATSMLSRSE